MRGGGGWRHVFVCVCLLLFVWGRSERERATTFERRAVVRVCARTRTATARLRAHIIGREKKTRTIIYAHVNSALPGPRYSKLSPCDLGPRPAHRRVTTRDSEQDLVLFGGRHVVDDDLAVERERREDPRVGRRPRRREDALLVVFEGLDQSVRLRLAQLRLGLVEGGRRGGDGGGAPELDELVGARAQHQLVVEAVVLRARRPVRVRAHRVQRAAAPEWLGDAGCGRPRIARQLVARQGPEWLGDAGCGRSQIARQLVARQEPE